MAESFLDMLGDRLGIYSTGPERELYLSIRGV